MTTAPTIRLGYQVGSGLEVTIPLKHLAICGQTQEAGKTTALEALITRAGVRALTFVTKRGEGAFTSGRPTAPYFREQADWRFVSSLLEAFLGERLKFERSWIMRATKKARTLADVRRNIQTLQVKAKGLSADVYMVLGEYLDELVPAIAAIDWAPRVELGAGVNVMDLASVPTSMQHLVIKSSIDWVLEHEEHTVVVVPEAWKFIPQGRGTPVRHSAMAYIRQGAALGNYLWLDSQDLGGVDKELLRSVAVWILGVQREANEIKRTLSNIPATVLKPSAADLATLGLGQFYACWGRHAIKTYAQPAWMAEKLARDVATGLVDVHNASAIAGAARATRAFREGFVSKEDEVTKEEAARLKDENETLRRAYDRAVAEGNELRRRLEALEKGQQHDRSAPDGAATAHPRSAAKNRSAAVRAESAVPGAGSTTQAGAAAAASSNGVVDEATYQAIKARLIADAPQLLKVLVDRPELEVAVERQLVTADGTSTKGRVARLIAAEYLADSKRFSEILRELERTGTRVNNKSLSVALQELVVAGFLTKESVDRYKAVADMRVRVVES